jgi:hypothetical protein
MHKRSALLPISQIVDHGQLQMTGFMAGGLGLDSCWPCSVNQAFTVGTCCTVFKYIHHIYYPTQYVELFEFLLRSTLF